MHHLEFQKVRCAACFEKALLDEKQVLPLPDLDGTALAQCKLSFLSTIEKPNLYGGEMVKKFLFFFTLSLLVFTISAFAQVSTKTGTIFGKAVDDTGKPLPGVSVTLESSLIPTQTAITQANGGFRFANLPPGNYAVNFSLEGFTEVRQEEVQVTVGRTVELSITLKPSLQEEFTVMGETTTVDTTKTGNESSFSRTYLDEVPSGRDPWVILDQTPGIDNDRYNVAGSESGQQSGFFARGGSDANNQWNIDGINSTDPVSIGASPQYYDFDAFEEIQVASGGNDASIQTGGVVLNIVSKRAGNNWAGNGSGYFVNHDLQGNNTPEELVDAGVERSNRINEVWEYGFDVGGPIVKDKFFAWGAYRRNQINLFTRNTNLEGGSIPDDTKLKTINFKANFNWNSANESMFSYNKNDKDKEGRGFAPNNQSPETLWTQGSPGTILEGIWSGQHTWIPNDQTILTARYGYIGLSFGLIPVGGNQIPMIYQYAISKYTNTAYYSSPIDRPANDFNVDMNYYRENVLGGDHEFKFGFEYKSSKGHTFSSYGNGVYLYDYNQIIPATQPGFELTDGKLTVQHFIDGHVTSNRTSFYVTDTYRRDRLTLNLGFRVDNQGGKNESASIPGVVGFESLIGPLEYPGSDLSPSFTDISPRIGATYDLTGDGKTILRGNFAQYYDPWNPFYDTYSNPTYVYNGFKVPYDVTGQGLITLTENDIDPTQVTYYGGLNGPIFDLAAFEAQRLYAEDLGSQRSREFIVGFEREIFKDASFSVNYTYRKYDQFVSDSPFGVTVDSYVPGGTATFPSVLGTFSIPYSVLATPQDGTHILENLDNYNNTYNGVDLIFRKRMSNNFLLNSSFTLQRQKQEVGDGDGFLGAVIGDGFPGRIVEPDPTQVVFYDGKPYSFVSTGSGKSGVYPYAEWSFRLSGVYQFPAEISVGAFARYQQGYPYVLIGQLGDDASFTAFDGAIRTVLLEPVGDRRYDNIFTLDLNVQKVFNMGNAGRITLAADLFNVTNNNAVVQRQRLIVSPTFNAIQENISPRALRFGVRYSF